ncbi:predicted protein [Phaeodactylum tricornutum CCAP 1055/1]|uniref:MMS19 nucleotide excision repair protein n=2 Tax=Phaeodactylum tricornutum TaxID=2850 RepID=B7G264_PHATC|nr:predicted protein [Phaeodactylum tricornutum CCAP 1055/1]EEC47078.1 predicted protein [Phaeodactylum tricornutum CCAP 1055/1]|eukprot:XP_002181155.1 predicted protein [Phaeodactylum tricornutum CCAP 1055/1]
MPSETLARCSSTGSSNNDESRSTSSLSTTTEELFRIWQTKCRSRNNEDRLRKEACSFFRSLCTHTTVETPLQQKLTTRASHEEALAVLIRELGPVLQETTPRIVALHCLLGALEGCAEAGLSSNLTQLLGNFLLTYCGPIVLDEAGIREDMDEDYEEQVRDIAIQSLTVLIESVPSDVAATTEQVVSQRLALARAGVERRCAAPELEAVIDGASDHNRSDTPPAASRVASGLSTLPRSRRSYCFGLLQSAVDSVGVIILSCSIAIGENENVQDDLIKFAQFTAICLHGESDPRCLMQLLVLLGRVQRAWYPVLKDSEFPVDDFFDAVAPYYPIQFTPPPNNPHGITREGLSRAILEVLTFVGYDKVARDLRKDPLIGLSLGIVLERIVPPAEDGPANCADQLLGIKDLSVLLFGSSPSVTSSFSRLELLDSVALMHLSDTMLTIHDEASMAVVKGGAEEGVAKDLAVETRKMISQIGLACERANSNFAWDTFVAQPLQSLSSKMVSEPSSSRTAIAYMACLCSCGGPKTLRRSLETGLSPLLENLLGGLQDDRDEATAIYGVGLESAKKDGVLVHPHPLQPYSTNAVDKLCCILGNGRSDDSNGVRPTSICVAAIRALDSVLVAAPAELLGKEAVQKLALVITAVASELIKCGTSTHTSIEPNEHEWLAACCRTVGAFVGKTLNITDEEEAANLPISVLQVAPLNILLKTEILPSLVSASQQNRADIKATRYDRNTLAIACTFGQHAAASIVQILLRMLNDELKQGSSCTLFDVIETLSTVGAETNEDDGIEARFRTSMLELPPTNEDSARIATIICQAYDIIPLLLPSYQSLVSAKHLERLVSLVSPCLPPLTQIDAVKVSLVLPFLATSLQHSSSGLVSSDLGIQIGQALEQIVAYLCDFTLDPEYDHEARSYAAACLQISISRFIPRNSNPCRVELILKKQIIPLISKSINRTSGLSERLVYQCEAEALTLSELLSFLGVLASAAACCGACTKKSGAPFSSVPGFLLDVTVFDRANPAYSNDLAIEAASALGSVLSVTRRSTIWKQRLSYLSAKRLEDILSSNERISPGGVASACYIICSSNIKMLSRISREQLIAVVSYGLSSKAATEEETSSVSNRLKIKKLVLAAYNALIRYEPWLNL